MTIIEAFLFIIFTAILVYFWILILGLATMVTQQEENLKRLEVVASLLAQKLKEKDEV
jgi:hypothetical protein